MSSSILRQAVRPLHVRRRSHWQVPLLLALLLLLPIVDVFGLELRLPELLIYGLAVMVLLLDRSRTPDGSYLLVHVLGLILFIMSLVIVCSLNGSLPNRFDIFIVRQILQVCLAIMVFERLFARYGCDEITLRNAIIVGFVPAIVVVGQYFDIGDARQIVLEAYKQKFFFLEHSEFADYRYASVFRDYFTAAVYFTLLSLLAFSYAVLAKASASAKFVSIVVIIVTYVVQMFVARSSLIMIPLGAVGLLVSVFLFSKLRVRVGAATSVFVLTAVAGAALLLVVYEGGWVNQSWVSQASQFAISAQDDSGSFGALFDSIVIFFDRLWSADMLLLPHHAYDLNEIDNPGIYSDSFYVQELYRYGLYGAIAYASFVMLVLRQAIRRHPLVFVTVLAFVALNVKGGNVFFMPRVLFLYAFVLVAVRQPGWSR